MYNIEEIRHVHLEISSRCNAACPQCPRNFNGYPYNDGYAEVDLSLDAVKTILAPEFVRQLNQVNINGNFGDFVMNPQAVEIVEYLLACNPHLDLTVDTNGSARNKDFWARLGATGCTVYFDLDGLEDTHSIYRRNTNWANIVRNAQTFAQAGGRAVWKMIVFEHNKHQVDQCRQASRQLGFADFISFASDRTASPVFDRQGNYLYDINDYQGIREFPILFEKRTTDQVLIEDVNPAYKPYISCQVKQQKSIYIAATGEVSPCCFLGLSPKTYGHGAYHQAANGQLHHMIKKNNALEYPLNECIEWFSAVENTWNIKDFNQGRLIICNDVCGKNNK